MANFKSLLWLVCFDQHDRDADGPSDHDQVVIAENADEAVKLWRQFCISSCDTDDGEQREMFADANPDHVFRIPEDELLNRTPRVLRWGRDVERHEDWTRV